MKITKKQLRKLIKESYRKLQKQQARLSKQGLTPTTGEFSAGPSKRYHKALRGYLLDRGIDSQRNTSGGAYSLTNDHELGVAGSISWPHGFTVVRMSLWKVVMSTHPYNGVCSISFSVSGVPEADAEFIRRMCALSDDDFLRIGAMSSNARVGSWESEIMPGYPHKFIGL